MIARIDGDVVVYRCGFAAEKGEYILSYVDSTSSMEVLQAFTYKKDLNAYIAKHKLDEGLQAGRYHVDFSRNAQPVAWALHSVKVVIQEMIDNTQSDGCKVYLSGPTNFRDGLAISKEYKGNRKDKVKPTHAGAIKDYIMSRYEHAVSVDEEADDVIAYEHYADWLRDEFSSVICTIDKDLNMIPGLHYNFAKKESYYVGAEDADRWFYTQLLAGDTVDNVPGLGGIGIAGAAKLLDGAHGPAEFGPRVEKAYVEKYGDLGREMMLEQGRLLWIRRNKGEMWNAVHQ